MVTKPDFTQPITVKGVTFFPYPEEVDNDVHRVWLSSDKMALSYYEFDCIAPWRFNNWRQATYGNTPEEACYWL